MKITDFPDRFARTKTETDETFEALCAAIVDAPPVAYKEDCRWIKLGSFGDTVDNPESGCLRTNANLLSVSGVELDYDLEEMTIDEAADLFRARGVKAFLYTSPSHTALAHRWRVLLPLSCEYPPEARDAYAARGNGVLGGVVSDESHTRSQGYYAGRVAGVAFEYRVVDGACIDQVDGLPEIGRSAGTATGPSGYTRDAAYEDIRAGTDLHRATNYLAMIGETRDDIAAAMEESTAKADDPKRWEKRLAELDRSIRGAQRRRDRDMQKHLATIGAPPRYASDKPVTSFETFTAASLHGKAIPEQAWLADGMIPAGQPVLLSGDGGLGKSLLALQLAVAVARGGQWLGMYVPKGPALYLSAEDETAELHRRIARITDKLDTLADLHIAPMAELDPLLVTPGPRGSSGLNTTALYDAVAARVEQLRPALVVLDSAADYFGGNEVVRSEVRWAEGLAMIAALDSANTLGGSLGCPRAYEKRAADSQFLEMNWNHARRMAATATPQSVLSNFAVAAYCVSLRAQRTASVPLKLYRRLPNGDRERVTDTPLATVLNDLANPLMTAMEAREFFSRSLDLYGNAFARIERNGEGQVSALWPLEFHRVQVERLETGRLRYRYSGQHGAEVILMEDMLHIRASSEDGLLGRSPLTIARGSFDLALSLNEAASAQAASGFKPAGFVTHPGKMSETATKNFRTALERQASGAQQAGRIAILEDGVKFQAVTWSATDAQLLESRAMSSSDICYAFDLTPAIVGLNESVAYGSAQQAAQDLVSALSPLCSRIEQALQRCLLSARGRQTYSIEHDLSGLLRSDPTQRWSAYKIGREIGVLGKREVRRIENLGPIDPTDDYGPPQSTSEPVEPPIATTKTG